MSFLKGLASDFLREPMIMVIIIMVFYIIAVPLLSFFLDFWFALILITVILFLGWLAVKTVYKDRNQVARGRMNNVP